MRPSCLNCATGLSGWAAQCSLQNDALYHLAWAPFLLLQVEQSVLPLALHGPGNKMCPRSSSVSGPCSGLSQATWQSGNLTQGRRSKIMLLECRAGGQPAVWQVGSILAAAGVRPSASGG